MFDFLQGQLANNLKNNFTFPMHPLFLWSVYPCNWKNPLELLGWKDKGKLNITLGIERPLQCSGV